MMEQDLAGYSNSKPIALSYASIFDVLWKQTELFAESKAYNTMQQEFIDIAAYESANSHPTYN